MKKTLLFICFLSAFAVVAIAQNVGIGTNSPDANAILHLESTSKGLLLPNIGSFNRTAMVAPPSGLLLYDFNTKSIWMHGATDWQEIQTFSRSHWTEVNGNLYRQSGRIGIGTSVPLAQLHVKDSNVLFAAPELTAALPGLLFPAEGAGTRMMWIPGKSVFRVGTIAGTEWNKDSCGYFSVAMGHFTKAKGESSFATGFETNAAGHYSTAMGFITKASGNYSTALGYEAVATGNKSFAAGDSAVASGEVAVAFGLKTTANDYASTAMGVGTVASNYGTTAMGVFTEASGYLSTAMGSFSKATGNSTFAVGSSTNARATSSVAIGRFNDSVVTSNPNAWVNTDPLFLVGNGTSDATRHNALVVYKNGNMILKNPTAVTTDPGVLPVPVSGAGTRLMWLPEKSAFRAGTVNSPYWDEANIGAWSFATGMDTRATGNYSFAAGMGTHASGIYSVALNANTTASGDNATAMGIFTTAAGIYSLAGGLNSVAYGGSSFAMGEFARTVGFTSVAMGIQPVASGNVSVALGSNTVSRAYASVALGAFNDSISTASTNTWVNTDPLLYLGNGTAFNRSNALVVYKNGNTDINGFTRLGESSNGAPRIKTKKITGFTTPSNANPNSFTFVPHGLNAAKILSISVQVNIVGNFEILPHSPDAGLIYTVNTDPVGGGAGPSIAVGVKSAVQSGSVMGRPIKIFITYEE